MRKFFTLAGISLLIIISAVFRLYRVEGNSMIPLLEDGQFVVARSIGRAPRAGDIVVFPSPLDGRLTIKKCTAIDGSSIFVTGVNLPESTDSRHYGRIEVGSLRGIVLFY